MKRTIMGVLISACVLMGCGESPGKDTTTSNTIANANIETITPTAPDIVPEPTDVKNTCEVIYAWDPVTGIMRVALPGEPLPSPRMHARFTPMTCDITKMSAPPLERELTRSNLKPYAEKGNVRDHASSGAGVSLPLLC